MRNIGKAKIADMGGGMHYINCNCVALRDTKNLFDKSASPIYKNSANKEELSTGVRAITTTTGTNTYIVIAIPNSNGLLAKTLTLTSTITASATNDGAVRLFALASNGTPVGGQLATLSATGSVTKVMPNEYPSGTVQFGLVFSANRNSGTASINDYVDYTNVQLEYGDTATSYEPYIGG